MMSAMPLRLGAVRRPAMLNLDHIRFDLHRRCSKWR